MTSPASSGTSSPLWAVVPAAGRGIRMKRGNVPPTVPKQYLSLAGMTLIERVLATLLGVADIEGVVVAIAPDDERFGTLNVAADARIHVTDGAATRAGSVAAALAHLRSMAPLDSRVLVHDAARPLVSAADIGRLIDSVERSDACGGLLAVPVQDTLKRSDSDHQVSDTVSRERLWQAQTPQLFRLGELYDALVHALQSPSTAARITDEASAMELLGQTPQLVEARDPNPKITRLADLDMALAFLTFHGDALPEAKARLIESC